MKITDVPAIFLHQPEMDIFAADGSQDALLIRIETDAGITGFGEIAVDVVRRCAVAT